MALGIIYSLLSSLSFALMAFSVKKLNLHFDSQSLLLIRSFSHLMIIVPIIYFKKESLNFKLLRLSWIRSVFGCLSVSIYYYSLGLIPLGDATLIIDTSPVFVFLISLFFSQTKVNFLRVLSVLMLIIGFFYLFNNQGLDARKTSYSIALLGPFFLALSFIFLKKSSVLLSPYQIMFSLNIVLFLVSFTSSKGFLNFQVIFEHGEFVFGLILFSFLAQYFLALSFKNLDEFLASLLTLLSVIWASLFDIYLLGTTIQDKRSIFYICVICSVLLMKLSYYRTKRKMI